MTCAYPGFIGRHADETRMDRTSKFFALAAAVLIVAMLAIMLLAVYPILAHL